jgi:agmatine deiminase
LSANSTIWPIEQGYRMPAEWSPHEATWLSWPHNRDSWPGVYEKVAPAMVEFVAALAASERVYINVLDAEHERNVRRQLAAIAPPERLEFFRFPTNDAWARDHGAIFVTRAGDDPRLALDFEYNAWGGKYPPYDLDRLVGRRMAEALGVPRFASPMVLEGGSIEVNGAGLMLTTEQCLLNPNRNPTMSREEIETVLRGAFGVHEIVWLGDGIEGDDTDGHIDDLTRFVAPTTVVTVVESNRRDPNHAPLVANRRRLDEYELSSGGSLEVVELPMPEPQYLDTQRLPASYANFYIANEVVLVPVFGCPQDDAACRIIGTCFPRRRVVPIDCRPLVAGLGTLHCLSQQVPVASQPKGNH